MDRETLLELAGLDALGLLEPDEQREFNICLAKADATSLRLVREVQDSVADLGCLLPLETPDATLRDKVLDAVGRFVALEAQTSLATEPVGRITQYTRRDWQQTTSRRGVWPGWRIAALVLFTVSAGLGWLAYDYRGSYQFQRTMVQRGQIEQLLRWELGRDLTDFVFRTDVIHAGLQPAATAPADFVGQMAVFYISGDQRGILVWEDFPASASTYRLLAGPADSVDLSDYVVLHSFTGGTSGATDFDAPSDFSPSVNTRWLVQVVMPDGERQPVLNS